MTQVRRVIPTILGAFGGALPTATKDHRGAFFWKRAMGSEDEIYAGMADSSNVAQWRRMLTKTYADTLYVPTGWLPKFYQLSQNSADVASNVGTGSYETTLTADIVLPTGTWTVRVVATQMVSHTSSGGVVNTRARIAGSAGTVLGAAVPQDPTRANLTAQAVRTGQSGTVTVDAQYRVSSAGTAYSGGGTLFIVAERTA